LRGQKFHQDLLGARAADARKPRIALIAFVALFPFDDRNDSAPRQPDLRNQLRIGLTEPNLQVRVDTSIPTDRLAPPEPQSSDRLRFQ
jgi:hypothetical protein